MLAKRQVYAVTLLVVKYKVIAQIVNMLFDPISSKEAAQQVSPC